MRTPELHRAPLADPPQVSLPPVSGPRRSTTVIAAGTCLLGALYLWRAMVDPVPVHPKAEPAATKWLGVDRWAFLAHPWPWIFLGSAVLAGVAVARWPDRCRRAVLVARALLDRVLVRLALSAGSVVLFWVGSTRRVNLDGSLLQQKIAHGVATTGAFVTHDEMLELYLHSRLWILFNAEWGWDVAQTYRVMSCLAGGVAVFLGLGLMRRFPAPRWPLVIGGLFAGGWVLLFFGNVENYTLTNVVVLAYLVAALRFLDDREAPLWPAGCLLAVATLCHLEALVLAPSGLVLLHVALRRGRRLDACVAAGALPALLAVALWWFDRHHGLPISDLTERSQISAHGGHVSAFVAAPTPSYFWLQLQLLMLLAPAVVLLPALLVRGSRPRGPYTTFLAVAAIGPLLMVALWRAQLGAYDDWDLYAIAAPPLGLLVFGTLATQARIGRQAPWLVAALVLMASQAIAWIVEHHV